MKKRARFFPVLTIGIGFLIIAASVWAQQQPRSILRLRRIQHTHISSPAGGSGDRWLEVRTHYETAPKWVDEMEFTYYVMLEGDDPDSRYNLLRGQVTNVLLSRGRHESVVYVHPDTLARYGVVKSVGVVAKHEGKVVGILSEPGSNERWWERYTAKEGLVYNRRDLPQVDDEDYPAIKARKN